MKKNEKLTLMHCDQFLKASYTRQTANWGAEIRRAVIQAANNIILVRL
jgi:hypothetical protein